MNKEKKVLHFDIKSSGTRTDDDGQEFGQITAYGAVFNNVDSGDDCILPGAFKRTIIGSEKRAKARNKKYLFPMLWSHDMNELIGGWYQVEEDTYGLKCHGEIALATQRGREYYALAKAGMSDQLSIIYDVPSGGAKRNKSGIRELSEMRLFTIDPVVLAMNEDTFVIGVKAALDTPVPQTKTFADFFQSNQASDLLEDLQTVLLNSFSSAVIEAFTAGGSPMDDVKSALDQFSQAVTAWTQMGIDCNLSQYIASIPAPSMDWDDYGMMSRPGQLPRKAGRAISAARQTTIDEHVSGLKSMAKKARSDMKLCTKSLHDAVQNMNNDSSDEDDGDEDEEKKSAPNHEYKHGMMQALQAHSDTVHALADKAMSIMTDHTKSMASAADDFANRMQGAESPAYGNGDGEADEDQQEGKSSERSSYTRTPTPQVRSLKKDTVHEEEEEISADLIESIKSLQWIA